MKYENKTAVLMKEKEGRKGETTICSHFFETVPPQVHTKQMLTLFMMTLGIYICVCIMIMCCYGSMSLLLFTHVSILPYMVAFHCSYCLYIVYSYIPHTCNAIATTLTALFGIMESRYIAAIM